jgi:two-component system, chemotaxis family, CheB/CheR fusion protein
MLNDVDKKVADPSARELQQQAIADLGQLALEGCPQDMLFERAVTCLSQSLNLRYVKLLELTPDRNDLIVRAGIGWHPGLVGTAVVPADRRSQAGFTLLSEETVVVRDFRTESRFTAPKLLIDHGIRCGASMIVGPLHEPWGVLGVHERDLDRCAFDRHDINFVRSVANILWLFVRNERSQREAERERRALQSFADAMPIMFSIVDKGGRYEFVNEAYRAFGASPEALTGRHVHEVLDPAAFRRTKPHMDRAIAGDVVSFENRICLPSVGERDVLVTFAPRLLGNGQPDGYYGAVVDISDQKRRQREILERTQQYRAIADSIPYGIWTCDAAGQLTYVSESFLDLVGMTFDQAANFGWISKLIPGSAEAAQAAWSDCVVRRAHWECEHRFVGSDGRHYDILAIARPVFDEAGDLLSYVGLNLDITERKRREETLALVSAELDHRVKNIFSLVITIARQASGTALTIDEFRQGFEGRMRALASAHEMIAEGGWEGMSLKSLVDTELAPYRNVERDTWRIEGPEIVLPVQSVQPLALAFHELATNAAKYGALKHLEGGLSVVWKTLPDGGVEIVWEETGLRGIIAPDKTGFGSRVLKQVLVMQLGADVAVEFRDVGLAVRIGLPSTCVCGDAGGSGSS